MSNLIPVEYQNQRILTTAQLAESYEADPQLIVNNFNRNKDRYTESKHFFILEGAALKEFRAKNQIDLPPNVNKFYLWTEKGAWLHAKSLNTDKAWEAYEMLVDDYYSIKQKTPPMQNLSPQLQLLINMELRQAELEVAITEAKDIQTKNQSTLIDHAFKLADIDQKVTNEITLTTREQKQIQGAVNSKAHNIGLPDAYRQIYGALKKHFGVPSYRDLKRSDLTKAFQFISSWSPNLTWKMK